MAKKIKAYVDTSAFIALLDGSDTYHPLFYRLFSDPPTILTTPFVLAEGQAWFLKRYDQYRALQFMSFIEDLKVLEIVDVGSSLIQESTEILRGFSDQKLTLADACGLALMKKQHIRHCWSTDFHLGLMGVPLVIHE